MEVKEIPNTIKIYAQHIELFIVKILVTSLSSHLLLSKSNIFYTFSTGLIALK